MSQYERRRRSNVLSGDGSRLPNGGNTRVGQRGSGHLAAFSVCLGGRLDKTGTHANDGSRGEAVGKPGVAGVYTNQRLNLSKPWEDLRMTSQGFKPGSGNPTVRHYRGALGNVRHGETETPSCNRKSGNGNPSPTAGRAQFLSQPSASFEARSAPRSYPTKAEVERASQQSEAMKIDAAGEMFSLSAWHLSEWRGPHPDLVGGFERDSAPIQKQAEHIEPADHKHDLARDRLTVLI